MDSLFCVVIHATFTIILPYLIWYHTGVLASLSNELYCLFGMDHAYEAFGDTFPVFCPLLSMHCQVTYTFILPLINFLLLRLTNLHSFLSDIK